MQSLLIFLFITMGAIWNVIGKPSPPTDLSENNQVFEIVDLPTNNESLKNSSSQNETANKVKIPTKKDISERELLKDEHLQPKDNEGKKRNKRCWGCYRYELQTQQPYLIYPSQTYMWRWNNGYGQQEQPPQNVLLQNNGGEYGNVNNNMYGQQGNVVQTYKG